VLAARATSSWTSATFRIAALATPLESHEGAARDIDIDANLPVFRPECAEREFGSGESDLV
jgi:hypothetical protein